MDKEVLVYKFKTPKGNYIYDINTNMIICINDKTYNLIDNVNMSNSSEEYKKELDLINEIRKEGMLLPRNIDIIEHPEGDFLESTLKRRMNTITLQITQQCNLRCKYCVYSGSYNTRIHSNNKMNIETAKKAIDFLVANSVDSPKLDVGFYGGEPLLRYDFIKQSIEYAEYKSKGKELSFHITTNATLLTSEMVSYFEKHNVSLTISLDGEKKNHDENRVFAGTGCGSFDIIIKNLEEIKRDFPEYFNKILFNTVIDPKVDFSCTNSFFTNYETVKDASVMATVVNDNYSNMEIEKNEQFVIAWEYELFKLYLSKLGEINKKYTTRLQDAYFYSIKNFVFDRVIYGNQKRQAHPGGPCIPGIQKLFINTDGIFYPCERVSENSEIMQIGNIETGFDMEKVYKLLNIGKITQEQCKHCFAFEFCGLCAAFADNLTEISKDIRLKHCKSTRNSVDNLIKNYCMLREFGYDFEKEI